MATDSIIYKRSDCHSLRAEANWGFRNVRVRRPRRRVFRARARTKSTSRHGQGCQHSYRSSEGRKLYNTTMYKTYLIIYKALHICDTRIDTNLYQAYICTIP